jgi:hypothetical protein
MEAVARLAAAPAIRACVHLPCLGNEPLCRVVVMVQARPAPLQQPSCHIGQERVAARPKLPTLLDQLKQRVGDWAHVARVGITINAVLRAQVVIVIGRAKGRLVSTHALRSRQAVERVARGCARLATVVGRAHSMTQMGRDRCV